MDTALRPQNSVLITRAILRKRQLKDVPYFLCGDFNYKIKETLVISNAISAGFTYDVSGMTSHNGEKNFHPFSRQMLHLVGTTLSKVRRHFAPSFHSLQSRALLPAFTTPALHQRHIMSPDHVLWPRTSHRNGQSPRS